MFNMLNLEALSKGARLAEKISAGIVDDAAYNVVTQSVNESVLIEAHDEIEHTLKSKSRMMNSFDMDDLKALEESVKAALVGEKAVSQGEFVQKKTVQKPAQKSDGFDKKATGAVAEKKKEVAKVQDKLPANDVEKPKEKVVTDTSTKVEVKDTEPKLPNQGDKGVAEAPKAESNMKKMQGGAEKMVNKATPKQDVPKDIINEGVFKSYVESLKTPKNATLIEGVLKAFTLIRAAK